MKSATDLVSCVQQWAEKSPDSAAVWSGAGRCSFADLLAKAERVAGALRDTGIAPGDRVAFIGKNCQEYLEVLLGASIAGSVMVGINWRLVAPEIAWIIEDASPKLMVANGEAYDLGKSAIDGTAVKSLLRVGADGNPDDEYRPWRDAATALHRTSPPDPADILALVYTSGTTGRPKGAPVTHRALDAVFQNMQTAPCRYWTTPPEVSYLLTFPMFNISGYQPLYAAFRQGCSVILHETYRAADVIQAVTDHRVEMIAAAPTMLQMLLEDPAVATGDFSRLKYIGYGAAPMPPSVLAKAMQTFGAHVKFSQGYGMTENCGMAAMLGPEDHDPAGTPRMRSVGRALDNVHLKVVGPDGEELPPGEIGEIWLKSNSLMTGYWNNPEATAKVLTDGWYHTGDAAYLDEDGYIYLGDRLNDVIIAGGANIYPAEVEGAVASHPAVQEVAVVGVPDEKWGQSPRAFVVVRPGHTFDEATMLAHLEGKIAKYKLPRSLRLRDSLPKNASGKIMRRELHHAD